MKYIAWAFLVLALLYMGWEVRNARARGAELREQIVALETARGAALATARADSLRAAEAAAEVARLEEIRETERRLAEARARNLAKRADSLSAAIQGLVPAGEAQEQAARLLAQMRASYEERIADLEGLVALGDQTIAALRGQVASLEAETVSLRRALEVTTEQRDLCMEAANPGLWDRVRGSLGLVGGTLAVGLIAGLAAR